MVWKRFISLAACALLALVTAACGDSAGNGPDATERPGSPAEKAAALLDAGDPEGALAALDALPPGIARTARVLHLRGRACLALPGEDRSDEAAALFRQALDADPRYAPARIDLARHLTGRGSAVEAIRLLEEGVEADRESAAIRFQIARTYMAAAEIEGALRAVNEGLEIDPASAEGLLLLGKLCFENTRNRKEGLLAMRRALEIDPDVPGGRKQLAGALTIEAHEQEKERNAGIALDLLDEAIALDPALAAALLARGRLLVQAGRLDAGLADLRAVHDGHADDEEVTVLLAQTLKTVGYRDLRLRKRAAALDAFREAVALEAPGVDVTVIERILAGEEGAGEDAERESEEQAGKEGDEKRARALFEKGSAKLRAGKADGAIALFRESLALLPKNPFVRHHLGLALLVKGETDAGAKELERAVAESEELEVDLPAAYVKLAEIALGRNRNAEAGEWLDRHDRLYPERADDEPVRALRALLDL